jgi:hypothetical protein
VYTDDGSHVLYVLTTSDMWQSLAIKQPCMQLLTQMAFCGVLQGMTDYVAAINSTYSSALYKLQPVVDVKSVSCDGDSYPTTPAAGRRRLQQGGNSTVNILAVTTTIDLTVQRSVNATLNKTEGQDDAVFDEAIAEMKQGLLKNLSDAADALSRQASDYSDTAMAAAVRNSYGSRILGVPIHNSQVQPPKAKLQTDTRPANNASSAGGGKEELEAGTQDVTDLKLESESSGTGGWHHRHLLNHVWSASVCATCMCSTTCRRPLALDLQCTA